MDWGADLSAVLSDAGIAGVRQLQPGRPQNVVCPKCQGGRTKEKSLRVFLADDGAGVGWVCYRGKCGWQDGAKFGDRPDGDRDRKHGQPAPQQRRRVEPPPTHSVEQISNRPDALYAFFARRGISRETVDTFGVYLSDRTIPGLGARKCLTFPYVFRNQVANRKYRPPEKQPQAQEANALPTLFNVDAVVSDDVVVWVEGEPDVMAVHEAGYPQVVTLKDGAPAKLSDSAENDGRFAALATHADLLQRVKKIVLAGDMDEPGMVLREELARRLGRHRCWIVRWPAPYKDACDVLAALGPGAVQQCIESAEPYPIAGMQRLDGTTLLQRRREPPPPLLTTGVYDLDKAIKWPGEGRLIIVTGVPNSGKSSLLRWLMVRLMERHERRFVVFSPEMQPWADFVASCAQVLVGKPFWGTATSAQMTDSEVMQAEAWLRTRLTMLVSDAEDEPPTQDWIFDRARYAILRDGATDLVIDPYNELEHQRGEMSETEYVGRFLQRQRSFSARHGCNSWVVAHPRVLQPAAPGKPIPPPALYDIAGSAHWANKSDLGLTVHNEPGKPSEILLRKSRFSRWGRKGNSARLEYDVLTGRFSAVVTSLIAPEDDP